MRKILPLALILSLTLSAQAQVVQWASKVVAFSSQVTPKQYSANMVLGKPNVLPGGGHNPGAWQPDKPGRKEYIKVSFDNPMQIRQVAVAESVNPTALFKVTAFDENGTAYELQTLNPAPLPIRSRMLNVFVELTAYKVAALRLDFDGGIVPNKDYFGIDAIGISDSNFPIVADITQSEAVAAGIIIEPLDKNVNSDFREINPLLSPDGKTMFFSRANHPENIGGKADMEDIWYSELDEQGHWRLAKNMGPEFNDAEPNFVNSVLAATPDGNSMILLLGNKVIDDKTHAGVSITTNVGGKWSTPKPLNIINEHNFSDQTNYFLANNRITLLMSKHRTDSHGDRDLYVSFLQADSIWSEPLNLGSVVNTHADDVSPYLAVDDKTLYYSSKGFSGMGGFDVYMTKRLDDTWTNWSVPENMGKIINSHYDDLYFNMPSSGEYSYYSRGVGHNNTDIFQVKLPPELSPEIIAEVKGSLVDAKTDLPIGATIVYERLPDGKKLGESYSDPANGKFDLKLPMGYFYAIHAEAKNYISESQNLDLRNLRRDKNVKVEFKLRPIQIVQIEKEAVVRLNSIFFDFAKAILKPESFPELDRVVKLLNDKPNMTIEVDGHTDNVGPDATNLVLSQKRADAVKAYLVTKGIVADRVKAKGFGETRPLVSNDDEEGGREINRRVEFRIERVD